MTTKTKTTITSVVPVNARVLVLRDKDRSTTKGGIVLPNQSNIPSYSGRVLALSEDLEDSDFPIKPYDIIIVDPDIANCVRVDFEDDQKYLVPIEAIVGKIQRA